MSKIIIIEGARGGGKSSVAQSLRHRIEGSTLINPTGFKLDGDAGLKKIKSYYEGWMTFLRQMSGRDFLIIFDRFFFSEMVYSTLYKSYDFYWHYDDLCKQLLGFADEIHLVYLTVDPDNLEKRLVRDKVILFESVAENVAESLKQQAEYDRVMTAFHQRYGSLPHVNFVQIDTSLMTIEQVRNEVMKQTRV